MYYFLMTIDDLQCLSNPTHIMMSWRDVQRRHEVADKHTCIERYFERVALRWPKHEKQKKVRRKGQASDLKPYENSLNRY